MIHARAILFGSFAAVSTSLLACVRTAPAPVRATTLSSLGSEEALESMIQGIEARRAEAARAFARERRTMAAAMATVPAPTSECRGDAVVSRRVRRAIAPGDSLGDAIVVASARLYSTTPGAPGYASISLTGPTIVDRRVEHGVHTVRVRVTREAESALVSAARIGFRRQNAHLMLSRGDSIEVVLELCELAAFLNQVVTTGTLGPSEPQKLLNSPSSLSSESVTNVQHTGIDEGGIVKRIGDYLVILRQGRLYSVRVADSSLRAVAAHPASPPGAGKGGVWLDELLTFENQAVVIGYNYEARGSEVSRFRLSADGQFEWMETQHFSSNDYFSTRNYSSRLIGDELVLYTPVIGFANADNPRRFLPQMRRWAPNGTQKWQRTATGADIYVARAERERPDGSSLHVVTRCPLRSVPLQCRSIAMLGAARQVFYVSPRHIYLWTGVDGAARAADTLGVLFRVPLDGGAPSAVRVHGMPIDQFSFYEDSTATLHVLTDPHGTGTWMGGSERRRQSLKLVRLVPEAFGNGDSSASPSAYRLLAPVPNTAVQSRFVRDYLLIGVGNDWGRSIPRTSSKLQVVPLDGGPARHLHLNHSVDRVEAMGRRAMAIGLGKSGLQFSAIELDSTPQLGYQTQLAQASAGETRSHAFFYHAEGDNRGMLGFPVRAMREDAWSQLFSPSMRIALLRDLGYQLVPAGSLQASTPSKEPPNCVTSCADWYGNSRPLFLDGRILALLGDEIVEGVERNGEVVELRRIRLASTERGRVP